MNERKEIEILKQEISKLKLENNQNVIERDRYLHELLETRNSKTYIIAKGISSVAGSLRGKKRYSNIYQSQRVYTYMISVIIPVYNTEKYISELLDSIIVQKQDVLSRYLLSCKESRYRKNAYENIYEVIIVDDGSTDKSGDICDEYAKKYPWIKVIHKKNEGVSEARNTGIEYACGKYITFPDSDDKLSENVLEEAFVYFENHEDEIALVTYPSKFFDATNGEHWTCYRFKDGNRIIDMQAEWDKPQYFISPCLFKLEDIKGKIRFDKNLVNGEDIKFVHELFFKTKAKIGVLNTCTYWYRKRSGENKSAIQDSKNKVSYYNAYVTDLLMWLKEESEKAYGEFPKYVQYAIMGQLQWRLRSDGRGLIGKKVIGEEKYRLYCDQIKRLIQSIDVDVIVSQRELYREHLFYACSLKNKARLDKKHNESNIQYYFDDYYCTEDSTAYVKYNFIDIDNGVLEIDGDYADLEPDVRGYFKIGEEVIEVVANPKTDKNVYILDEKALYVTNFRASIPLSTINEKTEIVFCVDIDGYEVEKKTINLSKFMPINKTFNNSYYQKEDWVIQLKQNKLVIWNIYDVEELPDFENEYINQIENSVHINNPYMPEALAIRKVARDRLIWKKTAGKQIWLVSDRYLHADDNGEAMFKYIMAHKRDDVEAYFVIDKESKDYERIAEIGPVVSQDSREHLILHLISDCIISSQADEYIIDPFWRQGVVREIFRDFYVLNKYVFLQHGIIKDNLSKWLNKYNKNINGFICAAKPEAKSIKDEPYFYDEEVWLTGLPRYDYLYHDEKKYILVMPTWRKWLMKDFDASDSDKTAVQVIDDIESTEFFEFYSGLLNNKKLLDYCEEKGYKLCFMPHVNLRSSMEKFCKDERIVQFDYDMPYRDAFAQANLLITDYSSTPMDFAYLKKPVIYTQFDEEKFFSGEHTYEKGYFDYAKDGFGEIENSLDSLIERIIEYIDFDCELKVDYSKRIEKFYAYRDSNNCKRVYEKICNLMSLNN